MLIGGYTDMTIPPPSALSGCFDDDSDYITDPDKVTDLLPQPYRLINKIVDFTFDIAWDAIIVREEKRIAKSLRIKPTEFECQFESKVEGAQNIISSHDGEYVFIGTENGITVVNPMSGDIIDQYVEDDMMNSTISASVLNEGLHIITTIDIQGIARLFLFNGISVNLAKILNEDTTGTGPKATLVEVSDATDYIAISLVNQNTGESWIDFHKVPKDAWVKEASSMKVKPSQQKGEEPTTIQESEDSTPEVKDEQEKTGITSPVQEADLTHDSKTQSNFRFSNTSLVLKIKAPLPLKPSNATTPFNAFKVIDSNSDLIANGQNHLLSGGHIEGRTNIFKFDHKNLFEYDSEETQQKFHIPTVHFIIATRYCPQGSDSDSGKPTGVIVRWSEMNQIMIYSLVKQAKDVNYRPEQIWPMPHLITASCVSSCTQLLAIGLSNGTVIIWDISTSLQRRIHSITPGYAIMQIEFMNPAVSQQEQPFQSHLPYQTQTSSYVLALSGNGQLSYCDTTMGLESSKARRVLLDELDSRMVKFSLLPGIPFMILSTFGDGNIYIVHALNGNFICQIVPPSSHYLDEDCLGTVAARGQSIFCKALKQSVNDQRRESEIETEEYSETPKSTLFFLQCLKFQILETSWSKELPETPFVLHTNIDKRLDALMQQRFSQQPIRMARLQTAWQNMGSTLELILKAKQEEKPPSTSESTYAASTVLSEQGIHDNRDIEMKC